MDPHDALLLKVETLVWAAREAPKAEPRAVARSILSLVADALGEPSEEMLAAGRAEIGHVSDSILDTSDDWIGEPRNVFKEMLAASPLHPQGDSQQPKDEQNG